MSTEVEGTVPDPEYVAWLKQEKRRTLRIMQMKSFLPAVTDVMVKVDENFSSFMLFQNQDGDYSANLRKLDGDGRPVICWASGATAITALLNLDHRVENDAFKPDLRQ